MVCSNCHSKDVIAVQGEYFCVNCGQLIDGPPAQVAAPAVVEATGLPEGIKIATLPGVDLPEAATQVSPVVKKRKVGRPKAGKLDVPAPIVAAAVEAAVEAVEPAMIATPIDPVAPRITNHSASRTMSDIAPRPVQAPQSKAPVATEQPAPHAKAKSKPVSAAVHQAAVIPPAPAGYGEITTETWRERFHPAYLLAALVPVVFLAALAAGITLALSDGHHNVLAATRRAGWAVGGEVLWVACLYYIGRSLGHSAILYGAARRSDHRRTAVSRWIGVAVNSFGKRLGFDIALSLAQLVIVALAVALVLTGGVNWQIPELAQVALLFVVFGVLMYALVGLGLTQGFGRVALTLSVVTDRHAFGLGWRFFRRHFDLVGFKIFGYLAELVILIPLGLAAVAGALYAPHQYVWAAALGVAVMVGIGGALIGAGAAVWWQATYRQLVRREHLSEAMHLLAGHQPERPRTTAVVGVTALATILVVTASVWPWLPWPH